MKWWELTLALGLCVVISTFSHAQQPSAARSVHLAFRSAEGTAFYNELTVDESVPGSYFMACGFSKGYFGIQELYDGKKVVLFSVWEPGKQDNPDATPEERRVKTIASGNDVRVKRFGGEGTGGQSFFDYPWKAGQRCRFVVYAKPDGDRTQYAGYFYVPEEHRWQHMATFSTLAGGHLLRGLYSFVEDFRRDGKSPLQERKARFGNAWAKIGPSWVPIINSRFTADATPLDNIDAGTRDDRFFLHTGGKITNDHEPLWSNFELSRGERKPPLNLPDPFGNGSVSIQRLRLLSYNIKHGLGNDGNLDLSRTAQVIRRLNPDIVLLQEVDQKTERSGGADQTLELSRLTGLAHHAFGSFFDYQGGKYGMATLSRFPIIQSTNLRLPDGAEPRTSLITTLDLQPETEPGQAHHSLVVANVHFYATESQRIAQANVLLSQMNEIQGDKIVAGDFNSQPGSPVLALFGDRFRNPDKGPDRFTFDSEDPDREIDFVLMGRDANVKFDAVDVIEEPVASDHRPVALEFSR